MSSSKSKNLISEDIILELIKISNSGLSTKKAEFILKVLTEIFVEVSMPEVDDFADRQNIHPIVWMLTDYSGKNLPKLFQLCLEISIIKKIPNHEIVLKEIILANKFIGARAEIFFASRIRTATSNVQFIPVKGTKTPDLEIQTPKKNIYVEVKGSNDTDFEIGIDMFEGWIRNRIKEIYHNDNLKRVVRFGSSWIGAIAAACNIKNNIENASWAFHSSIMSLVDEAERIVRNNIQSGKDELDIDIISIGEKIDNEPSIIIDLPHAKRIASIGNIIQKLTNKNYIDKFNVGCGVFAFLTRYAINKNVANRLFNTLLIQCPELRAALLGLTIYNEENVSPIFIHSPDSCDDNLWFPNYFKEPNWDETIGNVIVP